MIVERISNFVQIFAVFVRGEAIKPYAEPFFKELRNDPYGKTIIIPHKGF